MSLATTKADLTRSLLEGVAFNTRWLLGYVEKFAGQRLDPLRFIGGGATSDLWCQIHADVTGHRIERVTEPMTAQLRGAALIAAMALGALSRDEAAGAVPVDRAFTPDPTARSRYAGIYPHFTKLYSRQKSLFAALNG
jgi:xylulokinase